jgi:hypothetical protein
MVAVARSRLSAAVRCGAGSGRTIAQSLPTSRGRSQRGDRGCRGQTARGRPAGLLCDSPQVQGAIGRADAILNAGRAYRTAMITALEHGRVRQGDDARAARPLPAWRRATPPTARARQCTWSTATAAAPRSNATAAWPNAGATSTPPASPSHSRLNGTRSEAGSVSV